MPTDDFNRANSTTTMGAAYTASAGTWGISSNAAYCASPVGADNYVYRDDGLADVEVTVDLTAVNTGGPAIRQSGITSLFASLQSDGVRLYERNGSSGYVLLGGPSGSGSASTIKIVGNGSAIKVYQNGTQIIPSSGSITNTQNQTSTKHGFWVYQEDISRFDNLSIVDANASAGATAALSATLGGMSAGMTGTAGAAASSTGALSATLGDLTASASGTAGAAAAASATLAGTLGDMTASASGTAGAAAGATASLSATLGDMTATATASAGAAAGATASLDATLGALTPSLSGSATFAGDAEAALTATMGSLTASASGTAGTPAGSSGALDASLGAFTATATGTFTAAGGSSGSLTATLGDLAASASGTAGAAAGASASLAATLGSLAVTVSGSSGAVAVVAAVLGSFDVSASATAGGVSSSVGSISATLGAFTVVSIAQGGILPNILQALQERLDSIPAFAALLPGGYFTGPPSPDADDNPPYMVITRIGGNTVAYVSADGPVGAYIRGPVKAATEEVFQATLVGPDFDVLDQVHDLWDDNFGPRMDPLLIRRKMFRSLFNREPTYDFGDATGDPEGYNTCVYRWEFTILTTVWER